MPNQFFKRFVHNIGCSKNLHTFLKKQESCQRFMSRLLARYHSQWKKADREEKGVLEGKNEASEAGYAVVSQIKGDPGLGINSPDVDDFLKANNWKLELAWLTKAIEPALQLCKWALPTGNGAEKGSPPSSRSLSAILMNIQRSRVGVQGWSLSDLTIGLYLVYLRQAATNPFKDVRGVQIFSEAAVQDLIYHIELAKGAYKDHAAGLARSSMLRETDVVKYVKNSGVMRPGYYIGIDRRKKIVVLGIRGTHTVYDLITDIVTSSDREVVFNGYSTHFGTAEAARWFLTHEMGTIQKCLDQHEGFRLRLVGHSLGGATASLLAIMLRKKTPKELGFHPDIVTAVGFATPPCVSRELAENSADFVTTVVMQDDIIPRLSAASLMGLRNEIIETDWMSVLDKDDWKSVLGLFTNAKQVVSSLQDVARKLADFASFGDEMNFPEGKRAPSSTSEAAESNACGRDVHGTPEELFVPGTVYYLKRNTDSHGSNMAQNNKKEGIEYFTLWKRHPGEHFKRIVLSSNLFSDHKCDAHYYAIRDVLKGIA